MQELQTIADFIGKYGIIPVLVLVIVQLSGLANLRGLFSSKKTNFSKDGFMLMKTLENQNRLLLENHFQHEIPDMVATMIRIEEALKCQNDILVRLDERTK